MDRLPATGFSGSTGGLIVGIGIGAVAMYLLDPVLGEARRHRLRDQTMSRTRTTGRATAGVAQDLSHRVRGAVIDAGARFTSSPPSDDVLVERVRAAMGHAIHQTGTVEVHASDGVVTLSGSIPRDQVEPLLDTVRGVRGVEDVRNLLTVTPSEATTGSAGTS